MLHDSTRTTADLRVRRQRCSGEEEEEEEEKIENTATPRGKGGLGAKIRVLSPQSSACIEKAV